MTCHKKAVAVFSIYKISHFIITKLLYTTVFDAKISNNINKVLQHPLVRGYAIISCIFRLRG